MVKVLKMALSAGVIMGINYGLFAQTNNGIEVPNTLPPSPTAAELGKFALIGNSLSTGSANSHIELFNFKTKNLSVPVSLDYSANGLKVDMISSRVGMNWMLSAGGVISRTVNGAPDDGSTPAEVPLDFPETRGDDLLSFINAVSIGQDTQPDVFTFSFNDYSGRFIILNNTIKKLEQNNLKITGDVLEGFIITTPDGIKYTFNQVESSFSINSGNLFYRDRIKNAWFLTRIDHPKGDVITFSYSNCEFTYLASKTNSYIFYETSGDAGCSSHCSDISTQEVSTQLRNFGVYLTGIESNFQSSGSLIFNYTPRTDVTGDFFLNSINYRNAANEVIKTTLFSYTEARDRFFLEKLIHGDQKYAFDYYDLNSLPARLSYAQDYNGYYNGRNNNRSMISRPIDPRHITAFSARGFGERRPDPNFSKIGMLRKITYPTGGTDSLVYEGNTVYTNESIDCDNPLSESTILVTGSSEFKQQSIYYSNQFHIACSKTLFINMGCNANSHAGDGRPTYPNSDYLTSAQIRNDNTGEIININFQAGVDQHKTGYHILHPGYYTVILKVRGDAGGRISFEIPIVEEFNGARKVPGLRLKKVVSYDPISQNTNLKNYYYTNLATNKSSGIAFRAQPTYDSRFDRYIQCVYSETGPLFYFQTCTYTKLSSTPNFGLTNLSGNHIYYSEVTEGYGENFENGGVQHKFDIHMDSYPAMIAGYSIYGSPISNSGVQSQALETFQRNFKKVNDDFIPIKDVITHYKDDSRLSERKSFFAMSVEPSAYIANTSIPSNPSLTDLKGVNVDQYDIVSKWIYPDTVKTIIYDYNGLNPVTSINVFEYHNTNHQLVNAEKIYKSDGEIAITTYAYPQDNITGLTTDAEIARQQLITDHNLSAVLEQSNFTGNTLIQKKVTDFKKWNAITAPETVKLFNQNLQLEQQLKFYKYDDYGNVLSQGLVNGPTISYLWSYGGFYPVCEIRNADFSAIENIKGVTAISAFSQLNPDKITLDTFLAGLKAGLPNAQITSYTYAPLNGLTSQTDAKGMTTYYEYDSFQRLKHVKDQNGNIVKSYDYHYKSQIN